MTTPIKQDYQFEIEVAVRNDHRDWHCIEVAITIPFSFMPNDDRHNPESAGDFDIDYSVYDARIDKIDGMDVRHLPRAVPDIMTQTLITAALSRDFHQCAMRDLGREG